MKNRMYLIGLVLALAGLSLALIGCQQAAEPEAPAEEPEEPAAETEAEATEAEPAEEEAAAAPEELFIYHWSEYIDPEVYALFEEETGITVIEDNFASNEEALAKLQAGGGGYDLIVPSDYMVDIMIEEGLLQPINHDNIPNLANVGAEFRDPSFDPGMEYCAPYQWGTTGIGVSSQVGEEIDSWGVLFDPEMAAPYAGRISMLNDSREGVGAALKYLGYSLNTTDEAELADARELLLQQKDWLYAYDSDQFEDLLLSGDTLLAHGWSGDIAVAQAEDENIVYVIPEEGAVRWVDNICIPADAASKEAAEQFINFILQPEIAAMITNYTYYGSPVEPAREFIAEEILNDPAIFPPPDVMAKLEPIRDLGEANRLYEDIWSEVQAE